MNADKMRPAVVRIPCRHQAEEVNEIVPDALRQGQFKGEQQQVSADDQ